MPFGISDVTDLTFDEAKIEYVALKEKLNTKVFPSGGTGWNETVLELIENRMNYLKTIIADAVCYEPTEAEKERDND